MCINDFREVFKTQIEAHLEKLRQDRMSMFRDGEQDDDAHKQLAAIRGLAAAMTENILQRVSESAADIGLDTSTSGENLDANSHYQHDGANVKVAQHRIVELEELLAVRKKEASQLHNEYLAKLRLSATSTLAENERCLHDALTARSPEEPANSAARIEMEHVGELTGQFVAGAERIQAQTVTIKQILAGMELKWQGLDKIEHQQQKPLSQIERTLQAPISMKRPAGDIAEDQELLETIQRQERAAQRMRRHMSDVWR